LTAKSYDTSGTSSPIKSGASFTVI